MPEEIDRSPEWDDCDHDWEEIDSQFSNETFTDVREEFRDSLFG